MASKKEKTQEMPILHNKYFPLAFIVLASLAAGVILFLFTTPDGQSIMAGFSSEGLYKGPEVTPSLAKGPEITPSSAPPGKTLPVERLPDLIITNMSFNSTYPEVGEWIAPEMTVKNVGNADIAPGDSIEASCNWPSGAWNPGINGGIIYSGLTVGESKTIPMNPNYFEIPGFHTFNCYTKAYDVVGGTSTTMAESDNTNNDINVSMVVTTAQPEYGVGEAACSSTGVVYEYSPEVVDVISCSPNYVMAMCKEGKVISGGCHCGSIPITKNYPESGSGDSNGWNGSFSAWLCQCESAADKFIYMQCVR